MDHAAGKVRLKPEIFVLNAVVMDTTSQRGLRWSAGTRLSRMSKEGLLLDRVKNASIRT